MSQEVAISVQNVKKSFKLPHQKTNSVKGLFLNIFRRKIGFERQHVLKGVSFDVKKGEFLGIVGRNGGGKSTLLRLLAQIYVPDSGAIEVNGNITPFIELGVGFNPDLTGRENVYLNGALLGLDRNAVDALYDDIVSFAELERFMDQKLKNYSSGMQVRLAFSVAIQAKTDILLIDEVLAVGDSNFQKKCFDVFEQFKREGRTVIFISHSMQMVTRFCDRAILMNKGKIQAEGEPEVIAAEYDMLNNDQQKNNLDRLQIKTIREAHVVDTVLESFSQKDTLVELGSAEGRHLELINSMGITTYGIEPSVDKKTTTKNVFKTVSDLPKTNIKGLLLLDNRKSLTKDFLKNTFKELDNGKLSGVEKIYLHLPFHVYQEFTQQKNPQALSHLGEPLKVYDVIQLLETYDFIPVKSTVYGTDQPAQYIECILSRFDTNQQETLWGYLGD